MNDVRLGNLRKANLTMADAIILRDIALEGLDICEELGDAIPQDLCEILENIYSIIDGTFSFDL